MTHISNWLFGFLAIFSLSFFGCQLQVVDASSKTGAMVYTQHPPVVGKGQQWPVYIDHSFTAAQQQQIDVAITNWNIVLNGYAQLVVVQRDFDMAQDDVLQQIMQGHGYLILPATPDNRLVSSVDPDHNVTGITPFIGGHWIHLVVSRLPLRDIVGVTMHELGHALGASHTPGGLMNSFYDGTHPFTCVDDQAMQQIADVNHWDRSTLNYCYWDPHAAPVIVPVAPRAVHSH